MWTSKNRRRYDRSKLRYPSDLTDDEWKLVEPLIPPGKPGGGKRTVIMREVVNGLIYVLSTGCQWRVIPKDLPPRSTVYDDFDLWSWDGTLDRIHDALYLRCRQAASRQASATAAIIDRPSPAASRSGTIQRGSDGSTRSPSPPSSPCRPCRCGPTPRPRFCSRSAPSSCRSRCRAARAWSRPISTN